MDAECLCRVCGISFDVSIYLDVIYSSRFSNGWILSMGERCEEGASRGGEG